LPIALLHICREKINMATKRELENKKELARMYYMREESQKVISEKAGVSEVTLSRWSKAGGWAARRSAETISRPALVNSLLVKLSRYLEDTEQDDINYDKLCKAAATIEKLDKKANVVDAIEVFMAFNQWLMFRQAFDGEVTPALIKAINHYQDLYITEHINTVQP
jgi:hypothetical protein